MLPRIRTTGFRRTFTVKGKVKSELSALFIIEHDMMLKRVL